MWKGCLHTFLLSHGGNYEFSRGYFLFPTEERKNSSEVPFDSSEVPFDSSEVSSDSSEEIFRSSVAIFDFLRRNLASVQRLKNQMVHFSEGCAQVRGYMRTVPHPV